MHLYGLIVGIAIIIGIIYFEKHQTVIPKNRLAFFEIGTIISAIIGARAYHVIDNWSYYSQHLSQIPATWNGGLGIFGALLAAFLFIFIFCSRFRIPVSGLLNSITPILPLCQAIGRFGNFVNHENPTWYLESILDLVLFFFLTRVPAHQRTSGYLVGYGLIRLFTEFFRTDTWVISGLKIGQLIGIIFIILGLVLLFSQKHSYRPPKVLQSAHDPSRG